MKKITLLLVSLIAFANLFKAQPFTYYEAPLFDNSTTQVRAPNGLATQAYMRACALVLASELTNIAVNSTLTSFGFTVNSGANATVPGTLTLYLENTTDVTFSKSLTFATAVAPMVTVYASTMNLPGTAATTSITVNLSTPFVYTGGGIYVAYDWFSAGPFATTPVTYRSNSTGLIGGCASAANGVSAPTTIANTNFRPCFLFGVANTFTNEIQVIGMTAPGRVVGMFNTPHNVVSLIKNASSITQNNIVVTLSVSGANTFVDTQTISSLGSGSVATVSFAAFNPTIGGLNTLTVTLPPDQVNTNNTMMFTQSVTCNEWAINPAAVSYTMGSVGFNTGSGIIAVSYTNPVSSTLTAVRGAISTNAAAVGNTAWGVLMSNAGVIVATTNTITISNTNLGTFQTFTFTTPNALAANTNYYIGFAQPANTTGYFPMGTYTTAYVPFTNYVTTALTGGVVAPLTSNLGYFGIEAIFAPFIPITAASTSINCGGTAILSATCPASYTWSTGPSNTSISVSPLVTTNYTISASNALGCFASNTVAVLVTPFPMSITSNTNVICDGQAINLSGVGANSYTWMASTGNSLVASSYSATPSANTTYTLLGSNPNGCSNAASFNLTVNPVPIISIANSNNIICIGQSVTLTATGANAYFWNTSQSGSIIAVSPTISTTFSVIGTNTFNCSNISTQSITVNSYTPGLSVASNSICLGAQASMTASGGAANSYSWSTGATFFDVITVSPTITTSYSVMAYSQSNNCLGNNVITINVLQNPTVTASASRSVMCRNESNTLTASGANTYSWSSSETTNSIIINPTAASVLIFTVTGTASNNCSKNYTFAVTVNLCTGLDGQLSNQTNPILIYPNPTQNVIAIDLDVQNNQFSYLLYNSIGQLVQTQKIENNHTKVDLSEQAPGIYFIHILQNNQNLQSTKVIKE